MDSQWSTAIRQTEVGQVSNGNCCAPRLHTVMQPSSPVGGEVCPPPTHHPSLSRGRSHRPAPDNRTPLARLSSVCSRSRASQRPGRHRLDHDDTGLYQVHLARCGDGGGGRAARRPKLIDGLKWIKAMLKETLLERLQLARLAGRPYPEKEKQWPDPWRASRRAR
jgi:hypothetical protein